MSQKVRELLDYRLRLERDIDRLELLKNTIYNKSPENRALGLSSGGLGYQPVAEVPFPFLEGALVDYEDQIRGELAAANKKIAAIEELLEN